MKTIHKYPVDSVVEMPKGAEIRAVGFQRGQVFLWAEIMPDETETEKREFAIIGTGHIFRPFTDRLTYVGSAISDTFVWHVYERRA